MKTIKPDDEWIYKEHYGYKHTADEAWGDPKQMDKIRQEDAKTYHQEAITLHLTKRQLIHLQQKAYLAGISVQGLLLELVEDLTTFGTGEPNEEGQARLSKWYDKRHKRQHGGYGAGQDGFFYWLWNHGYTPSDITRIFAEEKFEMIYRDYRRQGRKNKTQSLEACVAIAKSIEALGYN